ncbi:MAG: F0F1 ATP synthase subunit delta [Candidatus Methylumidiphilus sp.]
MSELATLARPYATAAYQRAKQTGSTDQWSQALAFLAAVVQDAEITQAAANPKADKARFTAALLDLCQGQLDTEGENFVRLLVANRRLPLAKLISEQFELFRAEEEGYIAVDVRTAYPMDDAERDRLSEVLGVALGKQPRLNVHVDESLIGGVVIKAGDRVIDASIHGQLQRLAKRLYN